MPSLRWDVEVFASTIVSPGPTFDVAAPEDESYENKLYLADDDLTEMLRANARGCWPDKAYVATDRVMLGRLYADGVTRMGSASHELVHHVKLRFVLVADEQPPTEAWGGWRLRRFDKATDMAEG